MGTLVITVHIIASLSLVLLVLMQPGTQGMGVVFGGSSSSLFGSGGAGGILSKLTIVMAIIFFVTSLSFAYFHHERPGAAPESVIEHPVHEGAQEQAPAQIPGAPDE